MVGEMVPVRQSVAGHPLVIAVDRMIEVHDAWEADDTAPNVPTAAFEQQLHVLARVAEADVPTELIPLHSAVARLVHEWNEYATGEKRVHGRPLPVFWAAFRGMLEARAGLAERPRRILEPVKVLLAQGVGYNQIAQHIYGHHGEGPFLNEYGQPDVAKIHQEADSPGTVIPAGWVHPADLANSQRTDNRFRERIAVVTNRENEDQPTPDAASIDELLREGQYVDVIAKVKRVSEDEVLKTAARLGIQPAYRPNLTGSLTNEVDTKAGEAAPPAPQPVVPPAGQLSGPELDAKIVELYKAGKGEAEIRAALPGVKLAPQKIAAVIRESRKQSAAEQPSASSSSSSSPANPLAAAVKPSASVPAPAAETVPNPT